MVRDKSQAFFAFSVIFLCCLFFTLKTGEAHFDGTSHMHPTSIYAELCPGECIVEVKHVDLEGGPERLDLMIGMDLTGSMTPILDAVKTNAILIMNDLQAIIPDSYFGCISFMDYPDTYDWCSYTSTYGSAGDYPYQLDVSLTSDTVMVASTINSYTLGDGFDKPESYTRVFYETYSDPGIGWRSGSKKILLNFGDSAPHDCNLLECIGIPSYTMGTDPGRNERAGDADDLAIMPTMMEMAANNITLLAVYTDSFFVRGLAQMLWECFTDVTGGAAFDFNSVPPGDIRDAIVDFVNDSIQRIARLTLVTTPGYEAWLTSITPPEYTDIVLDHPQRFTFDIEICVPLGTPPGTYTFEILADGDGAIFARQSVTIEVCAATRTPTHTSTPTATPTNTPTPTAPPTIPCCWQPAINGGIPLNSPYRDWHPTIANDNITLFFASTRPGGHGRSDIFMADRTGPGLTEWSTPVNLGPSINTIQFEASPSLTGDMQTLYFMGHNIHTGNYDIYHSRFDPVMSTWFPRKLVEDPVSSPASHDRHPYIMKNDSKIYFDSDRSGGSGNFDLWVATKIRGRWVDAQPLPEPINSSAYEAAPCIWEAPGEKELYFETVRYGISELFVSEWDSLSETWLPPKRMCLDFISALHPSINSPANELFYHTYGTIGDYDIHIAVCEATPTPIGTWYSPTATYTEAAPYMVPAASKSFCLFFLMLAFMILGFNIIRTNL